MNLLGEAPDMLRFLFVADEDLEIAPDATAKLGENADAVLERAVSELEGLEAGAFTAAEIGGALRAAIIEDNTEVSDLVIYVASFATYASEVQRTRIC